MANGPQLTNGVKMEPGRPGPGLLSPTGTMGGRSTTAVEPRPRGARSAAPSVDTRRIAHSAMDEAEDCEEGDVQFMEMKRRAGDIPGFDAATQSAQASFLGPNRALKDFGQKLKDINDALGELQARGIQHVANLPELVLIGDQSSGKSSLMSAIAGLALPRSTGTCTRCPIHIRVSRAEEWSCRVYLKIDYEYQHRQRPVAKSDVTAKDKFPPWVALDPNTVVRHEFKTIRDKFEAEDVENVLRCAQSAILNPGIPYQQYVPKLKGEVPDETRALDLQRIKQLEPRAIAQFSPNTVALEVKGPDLADLSFYDLPGVFMSAKRDEDTFLEKVVSNLACEYIKRPHALILWAVPMNQDAENSYAFSLIRKMRAGSRCVGIMTKADLLPEASSTTWLSMLKGEAHQTGLGYFVTSRQGEDLEEQNKMEEAFFNRTADIARDWPSAFDDFKDQCGVEKLKAFLSRKLGEEFSQVLPEVKQKVNDRISAIDDQLSSYPVMPDNPEMEIRTSLDIFSREVRDRVLQQDFQSRWDFSCMEKLREKIIALKPKYNVRDPKKVAAPPQIITPRPNGSREVIDLCDSPPTARSSPAPARNTKRAAPENEQLPPDPKRQRRPSASHFKQEGEDEPAMPLAIPFFSAPIRRPTTKSLADIRALIRRNAVPGQPGLVSTSVYQPLYIEAARGWERHLVVFINETLNYIQAEIMEIMERSFGNLKNTACYRESREHMNGFLQHLRAELTSQLLRLYNLESQRLFTKDEESLNRNKAQEKKKLVRHRHLIRWSTLNEGNDNPPVRREDEMTEEERAKEAQEIEKQKAKMSPDPYEPELSVAAYVRGYYLTASNRFVDNVAINVMSGLFPQIAANIKMYLPDKLGLMGGAANHQKFLELMSEGPEIERKRQELLTERLRLGQSMDIIVKLEVGSTSPAQQNAGSPDDFYRPQRSMSTAQSVTDYSEC
ncbi:P-loop containing nucleoside triphosphate hydrolase protein [Podospora aff. communis PSN243]|uniref:P-loop containing nucleoside triphosphate hydrolase protein n=1 Tax=Podospora aff. communis PSN243 TaxID=3040156 RepID=A0AAV9G847_9PEZI|nr:P-loop containing nucleoside triphosphate hydrolase protein [Podospora aff. communis PSN243]